MLLRGWVTKKFCWRDEGVDISQGDRCFKKGELDKKKGVEKKYTVVMSLKETNVWLYMEIWRP